MNKKLFFSKTVSIQIIYEQPKPRVTLDHRLDTLRQSLRQDIEKDQQFEARLRAALQQ